MMNYIQTCSNVLPWDGDSPCGTDGDDGDGQGSRFWAGGQRPPTGPSKLRLQAGKFWRFGGPKTPISHRKSDRELQPAALYIFTFHAMHALHPEACWLLLPLLATCQQHCCHCAILMARTSTATQPLVPPLSLPPMRLPPACAYLPPFALRFSALSAAQRRPMLTPLSSVEGRKCPFLLHLLLLS